MTDIYSRPGKVLHSFFRLYPDTLEAGGRVQSQEKGTQGLAGMVLPAAGGTYVSPSKLTRSAFPVAIAAWR